MSHIPVAATLIVTLGALGAGAAFAQSTPPKPKSPGEIAAASRLLVEKNADCLRQAKEQKLGFLKRRSFMRACMKDEK
jgi:hypothetical protein